MMSDGRFLTRARTVPLPGMLAAVVAGRPRVVASGQGRTLRLDGRRLGLLRNGSLKVKCTCGHSGRIPMADLVSRHGECARLRDAVAAMRCSCCGKRQIREVKWQGCASAPLPANTDRVPVNGIRIRNIVNCQESHVQDARHSRTLA